MSDHTAIEWTDATWNPVTGCTKVSPGCANCYIERTPPFRMEEPPRRFERPVLMQRSMTVEGVRVLLEPIRAPEATTGVRLHPDRLDQPLKWRKPRRIFVCSLADLFHDDVPETFIGRVFAKMALAPQHTFQVLTKRPERARDLLTRMYAGDPGEHIPLDVLPNVWLGVSIENARYTWRADVLREIPAAVRFISAEPLLGSLFDDDEEKRCPECDVELYLGHDHECSGSIVVRRREPLDLSGIDWVIAGGESGQGARPMHPDWARELRDACLALGVQDGSTWRSPKRPAFFFKQWGNWSPPGGEFESGGSWMQPGSRWLSIEPDGRTRPAATALPSPDSAWMRFTAAKAKTRLLDGREWNELPGGQP